MDATEGGRYAWEENFPKGYGHTSVAFLTRCAGFAVAKNGDLNAARFVVSRCVKPRRVRALRERYPHTILLPVISRNQLPLALAQAIDLPIWRQVALLHTVPRKSLNAAQRLSHKPFFAGYIVEGFEYVIVDDVVTQGGTVVTLRNFVLARGGRVAAVTALAYAIGSHDISPTKRNIVRLRVKFGEPLVKLLRRFMRVDTVHELTNSQIKYLLRFASVKNIEKRFTESAACDGPEAEM